MKKKTILRAIILLFIILWMLTVFGFSNQNGEQSSNLSREIASKIVKTEEQIDIVEPYIRKLAHLSEYALGGMLFLAMALTFQISDKKRLLYSFLIGIEYAIIDEVHQLFIDGRAGKVTDVLIDSVGVALGICTLMLVYILMKKIRARRKEGV